MENSKISWCDHTFNPWIGCTKVSPGCKNCYAEALNDRYKWADSWGPGKTRTRTSVTSWYKPLQWNEKARQNGYRPKVFCGSLCDVFDREVSIDWFFDLLNLIYATPFLDWLLLTKRADSARGILDGITLPEYVWIGASVENQEWADKRIPELLTIPAKIRFISVEPLLDSINLHLVRHEPCDHPGCFHHVTHPCEGCGYQAGRLPISWVICGGESGPSHREMKVKWSIDLYEQCLAAGIPFFMKQDSGPKPGMQGRIPDALWKVKEFPRVY